MIFLVRRREPEVCAVPEIGFAASCRSIWVNVTPRWRISRGKTTFASNDTAFVCTELHSQVISANCYPSWNVTAFKTRDRPLWLIGLEQRIEYWRSLVDPSPLHASFTTALLWRNPTNPPHGLQVLARLPRPSLCCKFASYAAEPCKIHTQENGRCDSRSIV